MAWKRQAGAGRYFSKFQRRRIAEMVLLKNMGIEIVAIRVGATPRGVRKIVEDARVRMKRPGYKAKTVDEVDGTAGEERTLPTLHPTLVPPAPTKPEPETDYLRWAVRGSLSHVGGRTFIERLLHDAEAQRITGT